MQMLQTCSTLTSHRLFSRTPLSAASSVPSRAARSRTRSSRSSKVPSAWSRGSASFTSVSGAKHQLGSVCHTWLTPRVSRLISLFLLPSLPHVFAPALFPAVDPGLVYINVCVEDLRTVDVRIQMSPVPSQTVQTRDNVTVSIDSVICWHGELGLGSQQRGRTADFTFLPSSRFAVPRCVRYQRSAEFADRACP